MCTKPACLPEVELPTSRCVGCGRHTAAPWEPSGLICRTLQKLQTIIIIINTVLWLYHIFKLLILLFGFIRMFDTMFCYTDNIGWKHQAKCCVSDAHGVKYDCWSPLCKHLSLSRVAFAIHQCCRVTNFLRYTCIYANIDPEVVLQNKVNSCVKTQQNMAVSNIMIKTKH